MTSILWVILAFFIGFVIGRYWKELKPFGKQFKKDISKLPIAQR